MKKLTLLLASCLFLIALGTNAEETKDYGPFNHVPEFSISGDKLAYIYYDTNQSNSTFVFFKDKTYGPFDGSFDKFRASSNNWGFRLNRGQSFVVDSKIYGPYDGGDGLVVWNDFFAFKYVLDEQNFVNVNEKILGPYDTVGNLYVVSDKWIFTFSKDGKYYVNANDEILGPFDLVHHLYLSSNHYLIDIGNGVIADGVEYLNPPVMYSKRINYYGWGYIYSKDGKNYVIYNGEEFGPYDDFGMMYKFELSGEDWYLNYNMNNSENFIKNGIRQSTNQLPKTNYEPKYTQEYKDNQKSITINDNLYGPFKTALDPEFTNENWAFIYSNDNVYDSDKIYSGTIEYYIKSNIIAGSNSTSINNTTMYTNLKGKIMLKVESAGEAFYIHPENNKMYYLGRPDDAFSVMREQGVGITNNNLEKIPVGLNNLTGVDTDSDGLPDLFEDAIGTNKNNPDSDADGYNDKDELIDNYNPNGSGKIIMDDNFTANQKGKIFLQTEQNGEAWYVNPNDGRRYFLGRPADAFQVMRNLGLGISNNDFDNL